MAETPTLPDAIRDLSLQLAREPHSFVDLNRAAARMDHLGRRLHGLGWVREHEIGGCLTTAVRELSQALRMPEADRREPVRRAVHQLGEALAYTDAGMRPHGI